MKRGVHAVKAEGERTRRRALVWFRKCLRLTDNDPIFRALKPSSFGSSSSSSAESDPNNIEALFPVFVIDPHFMKPERVGPNRLQFLLESLSDLDRSAFPLFSSLIASNKPS